MQPTLLIGLDGATFTVFDALIEQGVMPFLKDFIAGGISAELISTPNPLTPPAWISMITGRSPGNHGVIDFIWSEQRQDDHYFTLYNFRDIQCETIWSLVSRQEGRAGSLNFTMMSPPPEVNGYIIPGLVSWKHMRRNVHPRKIYEELHEQDFFNVRELAWDFDMEKKAEQGIPEEEYENWVRFHIRRERQWFETLRYLMQRHPCDLTAILFDGPDKLLHMGWRLLDPATPESELSPQDLKVRNLCHEYFRELDQFIADIVSLAGPEARVFMASDHGFGPSTFTFRVNTWLQENGYLFWRNIDELDEAEQEKAKKLIDKHFVLLDWDKTTAYARTVTSNGIYIRVAKEEGQPGVLPHEYDAFRKGIIDKLLALRHPQTGEAIVQRVMTREEAYPGVNNSQAPDLTLVMADFSFVSILNKTPVIVDRPQIAGTHYPEGIFLAAGPGIKKGKRLKALSILDVAPSLLHSLGLEIPVDFEGHLPEELFESSYLESHPKRIGPPTQSPDTYTAHSGNASKPEEVSEEIIQQLKALGYLE